MFYIYQWKHAWIIFDRSFIDPHITKLPNFT